jgi:hypothetical protein
VENAVQEARSRDLVRLRGASGPLTGVGTIGGEENVGTTISDTLKEDLDLKLYTDVNL